MRIFEIFNSVFTNKCPHCHTGKVFKENKPFRFKDLFEMNKRCSHCDLNYDKEPGFFYGAMYVSYALMAIILFLWIIVDLLWMKLSPEMLFSLVATNVLMLFPFVYRWARLLWLNFFFKLKPEWKEKAKQFTELHTH